MSTSVEVKAKKDLTWLHFGVMVVLMFGVGFIPPIGDITVVGMKMLGTFLGLLWLEHLRNVLAQFAGLDSHWLQRNSPDETNYDPRLWQ